MSISPAVSIFKTLFASDGQTNNFSLNAPKTRFAPRMQIAQLDPVTGSISVWTLACIAVAFSAGVITVSKLYDAKAVGQAIAYGSKRLEGDLKPYAETIKTNAWAAYQQTLSIDMGIRRNYFGAFQAAAGSISSLVKNPPSAPPQIQGHSSDGSFSTSEASGGAPSSAQRNKRRWRRSSNLHNDFGHYNAKDEAELFKT